MGSGTSGGTLAPLFTIGGGLGALLGVGVLAAFPETHINVATAALIGMAAMFAGASRALLTSIIFAFETTAQPHALLPLLGACTAAYFVSFFLLKGSIMTEKINRRGVRTPDSYEPDVLQNVNAEDIMQDVAVIINTSNTVEEMQTWSKENVDTNHYRLFVLADEDESFGGYVEKETLFAAHINPLLPVASIATVLPVVTTDQPMNVICEIMGQKGMDVIAVVSGTKEQKLEGVITSSDILKAYSNLHRRANHYHTHISIPKRAMRMIVRGRTLLNNTKNAGQPASRITKD